MPNINSPEKAAHIFSHIHLRRMKLLILVALMGLALAQDRRCRRRSDVCRDTCEREHCPRCPRFFTYVCPEREGGRCRCNMYHSITRRRILNPQRECFEGIERCKDKNCSIDSDCREITEYCRERDRIKCTFDMRIEAKCIRRSCDNVTCERSKECKMIRMRDDRKHPKCIHPNPQDCSDTVCNYNERCEMREVVERGRMTRRQPHCRNRTDEEMKRKACPDGWDCRMRKDCKNMTCEKDELCRETRKVNETIAQCIRKPIEERRCDEIDCEEGFLCKMKNRTEGGIIRLRPMCSPARCPIRCGWRPPRTCYETLCREDEDRITCEMEDREIIARCQRRNERRDNRTERRENEPTTERPRNCTERPCLDRRPPRDCTEIKCWRDERCHIFNYRGMRIASCISSCISNRTRKDCNSTRCEDGEECHNLRSDEIEKHAACFRDLKRVNRTRRAERCEELRCEGHSTCFHRQENGRRQARCHRHRREGMARCWNDARSMIPWRNVRDERCKDRSDRKLVDRPEDRQLDDTNLDDRRSEDRRVDDRRPEGSKPRNRRDLDRPQNMPDRCLKLECCIGERCIESIMDDGKILARCIPENETNEFWIRPLTCEELECEERFICREERETSKEMEIRKEQEGKEDRERSERRRHKDRERDEDRRREDRNREDRRSHEDKRKREERLREDKEMRCRRCCEDRRCGEDPECCEGRECCNCEDREVEDREVEDRTGQEDKKEDENREDERRCEDMTDIRRHGDREIDERRRCEDREREDERRRQNRERDEARRCEDRDREDRRRREDRDRDERRRKERRQREARCVPEQYC